MLFFKLHCCGIDQYQDWFNADIWTGQPYVPDSCCIEEINGCGKQVAANETYGLIYMDVGYQIGILIVGKCFNLGMFQYDSDGN